MRPLQFRKNITSIIKSPLLLPIMDHNQLLTEIIHFLSRNASIHGADECLVPLNHNLLFAGLDELCPPK